MLISFWHLFSLLWVCHIFIYCNRLEKRKELLTKVSTCILHAGHHWSRAGGVWAVTWWWATVWQMQDNVFPLSTGLFNLPRASGVPISHSGSVQLPHWQTLPQVLALFYFFCFPWHVASVIKQPLNSGLISHALANTKLQLQNYHLAVWFAGTDTPWMSCWPCYTA